MRDQLIDLITIGIARACVKEANGAKVDKAAEIADVLLEQTCMTSLTEDEWKFDEQIDSNPWNSDAYKTITFVSDDVVDEANYEGFCYLARREKLRELLICAYPHLGYNIAGGMESATYLANILLEAGYRESTEVAEEIFGEIERTARAALILLKFERDEDIRTIKTECYDDLLGYLAELKKKYTGKDTNVTTKETEDN